MERGRGDFKHSIRPRLQAEAVAGEPAWATPRRGAGGGATPTLMTLFRERILARLPARHAISPEFVQKLLGWRHPGFSVHVGEPIAASDTQSLEDMAR
jgi:hypothetical protein